MYNVKNFFISNKELGHSKVVVSLTETYPPGFSGVLCKRANLNELESNLFFFLVTERTKTYPPPDGKQRNDLEHPKKGIGTSNFTGGFDNIFNKGI